MVHMELGIRGLLDPWYSGNTDGRNYLLTEKLYLSVRGHLQNCDREQYPQTPRPRCMTVLKTLYLAVCLMFFTY